MTSWRTCKICKKVLLQFDGEEDKTGKMFFTDLTWKYHVFWQISPSTNLHGARWVILSAAFCFWTFLTKVKDIWKQKVEVTHIIRYQSWDWSGAVVLAAVHVREFLVLSISSALFVWMRTGTCVCLPHPILCRFFCWHSLMLKLFHCLGQAKPKQTRGKLYCQGFT